MSNFDFDPTEATPSRGTLVAIPAGKYIMHLLSFDEKTNSQGTGMLREGVWEVIDPVEFRGSIVYENINTHHDNDMAQKIGREQLSAICVAACPGVRVTNSDNLLGRPVLNTVRFIPAGTVDPAKGSRPAYTHTTDKNEITAHAAVDAKAPPPVANARSGAPPSTANTAPYGQANGHAAQAPNPAAIATGNVPAWRQARA